MDLEKLDEIINKSTNEDEKKVVTELKNLLSRKKQDSKKINELINKIKTENPSLFNDLKKAGIALFSFKTGKKNINNMKGYLFENLINILVEKSGFLLDFDSNQIVKSAKTKRMKGRGSTHQVDVLGKFKFSIPFSFNFLLIGECKALKSKVKIPEARNFLGVIQDIRQYAHVDLKEGGKKRYKSILNDQFRISPAFFSLKGFEKKAEEFLICHEIFPISYENNDTIKEIFEDLDSLAKQKEKEVEEYKKENKNYLKYAQEVSDSLKKIREKLSSIYSYFALINNSILVNVISNVPLENFETLKLKKKRNLLIHKDENSNIKIEINFSENYVKYLRDEKIKLNKIDVLFVKDNQFFIKEVKTEVFENEV
ncbi:MAG: hypothetical protein ABII39_07515 [Candidatus Micrarchaeota archaeon]